MAALIVFLVGFLVKMDRTVKRAVFFCGTSSLAMTHLMIRNDVSYSTSSPNFGSEIFFFFFFADFTTATLVGTFNREPSNISSTEMT